VGSFEAFYASTWQQPISLWLAAGVGAAIALTRRDLHASLRRYALALTALSLLDAWLTANHVVGLGALPGRLAGIAPLFFVLAGDFRYWLVVTAGTDDGALVARPRAILEALGLTLVVPVLTQLARIDGRALFLLYEVAFLLLAAAVAQWHPAVRARPWLRSLTRFAMLYYALWATADAILLGTGSDLGYALRVIPNWLYYGGFIAAVGRLAPAARR
jgi:hypothetical protein